MAILGILVALSFAAFRALPRAAKVTSGALELAAEASNAKSQAYGRDVRVAVLIYAPPNQPIRYWTVLDPWLTLLSAMESNPAWTQPEELLPAAPPAPAGARYRRISQGELDKIVSLVPGGYRSVVGNRVDSRCAALGAGTFVLGTGTGGGGGYFPPPYCMVPESTGCTFCSETAGALRGAIVFEPEGRVRLVSGSGVENPAGAGSFTVNGQDLPPQRAISMAFTASGLIHTFRGSK